MVFPIFKLKPLKYYNNNILKHDTGHTDRVVIKGPWLNTTVYWVLIQLLSVLEIKHCLLLQKT